MFPIKTGDCFGIIFQYIWMHDRTQKVGRDATFFGRTVLLSLQFQRGIGQVEIESPLFVQGIHKFMNTIDMFHCIFHFDPMHFFNNETQHTSGKCTRT